MSSCGKSCGCSSTPPLDSPEPAGTWTTASLFSVPQMDCPAEERLIRMALAHAPEVAALEFDLTRREVRVLHSGPIDPIAGKLEQLGLGAHLLASSESSPQSIERKVAAVETADEARVLRWLLAINAIMFCVEIVTGWLAQSTGLIADSLDMFADAGVYGLALYAVGRDAAHQLTAARLSGWLQLALALGAIFEVVRRLVFGSAPEAPLMMGIAFLALAANVACLVLLSRHRDGGVHMKASWIFSTNDVLANLGVIIAAALVAWSGSNLPDLVIGTLIALLVLNGARRILRLRG